MVIQIFVTLLFKFTEVCYLQHYLKDRNAEEENIDVEVVQYKEQRKRQAGDEEEEEEVKQVIERARQAKGETMDR